MSLLNKSKILQEEKSAHRFRGLSLTHLRQQQPQVAWAIPSPVWEPQRFSLEAFLLGDGSTETVVQFGGDEFSQFEENVFRDKNRITEMTSPLLASPT